MTASEDAWAAYADAIVYLRTPAATVRVRPAPVGSTTGGFPLPDGETLHVITAHNPSGVVREWAENAAAQASLEAELSRRSLLWWPAAGGDRTWRHIEASAAVAGLDRAAAIALAMEYGQDAIFELTPAFRIVIDCDTGRTVATGWSIQGLEDTAPEAGRAIDGRNPPARHDAAPVAATEEAGAEAPEESPQPYPPAWLGPDGYLTQLARREGLLMSLMSEDASISLHGSGDGTVSIRRADGDISGPYELADAMAALREEGVLGYDTDYNSSRWDVGEVAAAITPWLDLAGRGEFCIDGILMETLGNGLAVPNLPEDAAPLTLDQDDWELEGGGGSPGNADWGWDYLLRIGPRYVVIQRAGGEQIIDEIDARDDREAIERFRSLSPQISRLCGLASPPHAEIT